VSQIGIQEIGVYVPQLRVLNSRAHPSLPENKIVNAIGVVSVARMAATDSVLSLCLDAFANLKSKARFNLAELDFLTVVTQSPEQRIPHVSALLHGALELAPNCVCFDISLGCSGYVHALSIAKAFMEAHGLKSGVLITCDPYSKIIDPNNLQTAPIFGDAASATLLSLTPQLTLGRPVFFTDGKHANDLKIDDGYLQMNGRGIYDFVVRQMPVHIAKVLDLNSMTLGEVDRFVFHQGSKRIIDSLIDLLKLPREQTPFSIRDVGNTVSSSIPLILEREIKSAANKILVSGFGVGLSIATNILHRKS
jgi:3-oxoacyl-[acyl-carrier-protein] synthase-3